MRPPCSHCRRSLCFGGLITQTLRAIPCRALARMIAPSCPGYHFVPSGLIWGLSLSAIMIISLAFGRRNLLSISTPPEQDGLPIASSPMSRAAAQSVGPSQIKSGVFCVGKTFRGINNPFCEPRMQYFFPSFCRILTPIIWSSPSRIGKAYFPSEIQPTSICRRESVLTPSRLASHLHRASVHFSLSSSTRSIHSCGWILYSRSAFGGSLISSGLSSRCAKLPFLHGRSFGVFIQ